RIWILSRKNKTRHSGIKAATVEISHLDQRLNSIRKAIKQSAWSKVAELKHQCQSMERTVFDREEQKWRVSILELDKCPPKLPMIEPQKRSRLPRPATSRAADEESLG